MAAVSVIIPTFNRAEKAERAVASVLKQDFKDFEIVLVDDSSTDDTMQTLTRYRCSIKYIRLPVNRGVSAARNTGINSSAAPWIAFLDSDDYWLSQKLYAQMEFIDRNPETVACHTEEIWIRRGTRVNPKRKHRKPSGNIFQQSLRLCLVSPSSVILKRSLFEEVGLFDETLPAAEDYDLWLRISCRYPIYLIDRELVVKEGGHEDQLSQRFTSMDRFRIRAIVKLIKSGILSSDQMTAAIEELSIKCRIYGNGCVKRGRMEEGYFYLSLPERLGSNGDIF
ncbi:MAG: glycosyltransferase family 2 protein [Deltaproteobacteria bacterium]|nr:MAG: glycosyltransferase family 2 protein [Deltaproteobacteria bacterium]